MIPSKQAQGSPIAVATMVWIAILFSIGSLWFLSSQMPAPTQSTERNDVTLQLFAGIAAILAIASFVLPNFIIQAQIRAGTKGQDATQVARQIFFPAFVIRLALRDAIAVLGFVLASQGAGQQIFLYFGSAAAILIMLAKPSEEQIKEIEQKLRLPNSTPN